VREMVAARKLLADEFDMSLKGFDNERFALWRIRASE
jgi:hypothetical protein